ncbi:RNase Gf29 [Cubamyces menziesii]|nr:RNase Gf29 [Cubamyces menziesii]
MFSALVILGVITRSALVSSSVSGVDYNDLFKQISSGCSTSGPASCHNTTQETDLCCFEAPGGVLLQTQLWDTDPSTGPSNSWTIHGLWPDHCDSTFSENCDSTRDYTNITDLLQDQGADDTLSFMQEYWVDINGQNEQFWEHEWSTHGACYSTLKPSCLPSGSPKGAEAVAFFQAVTLPTYDFLAQAGITPSTSKTYSLSTLTDALKNATGVTPALNCAGSSLSSIQWYFNLKGSLIDGEFVAIDATSNGSCKSSSIKYPPKSGGSSSTTTSVSAAMQSHPFHCLTQTGWLMTDVQPAGSLPSAGTIHASTAGGLLSAGTWSTQTLATYHFSGSASSFTMTTSKGSCGVSDGKLACGSGVSSSTFSAVVSESNLLLAYAGSTDFSSDDTPSGSTQEMVYTGSSHSKTFTLNIISS